MRFEYVFGVVKEGYRDDAGVTGGGAAPGAGASSQSMGASEGATFAGAPFCILSTIARIPALSDTQSLTAASWNSFGTLGRCASVFKHKTKKADQYLRSSRIDLR